MGRVSESISTTRVGDHKTSEEIEQDVYQMVRTHLSGHVSGYVYRRDLRPTDRRGKEDVVVSFLTGLDGQVQTGVVVVNAYVPHTSQGADTYSLKDVRRVTEVARHLTELLSEKPPRGYHLRAERTVSSEEEEGVTRVTLRIKYKYNALLTREEY